MARVRTALLIAAAGIVVGMPALVAAQDRDNGRDRPGHVDRYDRGQQQPRAQAAPADRSTPAFTPDRAQPQPRASFDPDSGDRGPGRFQPQQPGRGGAFVPQGDRGDNRFQGRGPGDDGRRFDGRGDDRRFDGRGGPGRADDRRLDDRGRPGFDGDRRLDGDRRFDGRGRPGFDDDRRFGERNGANGGWNGRDGRFSRDWRNDRRYDWRSYRNSNRGLYRGHRYNPPRGYGYGYRSFGIGVRISPFFYDRSYWIDDPYAYRLPPAYGPYRWVRYYDDVLLVDVRTGQVVDVIHDFFW